MTARAAAGFARTGRACSAAYSRIVSSMRKRGSPSGRSSWRRRLFSRSASSSSSLASQTASAASSVQPPAKTASRANRRLLVVVEQLVAPVDRAAQRLLAGPGRSRGPPVSSARRSSSRSSIAWGVSSWTRAAASSIASGSPSSRAQISATRGAFSSVSAKSAAHRRARSTKRATASYCDDGVAATASVGGQRERRHRVLVLAARVGAARGW